MQAQERITLLLDWFINPDHGPIIIAQEKGYFADAGLEVEVIAPADPADPPTMVHAPPRNNPIQILQPSQVTPVQRPRGGSREA